MHRKVERMAASRIECLGYRSGERITLCTGEEATESEIMPHDGTYFHYAANGLGAFTWGVGFV